MLRLKIADGAPGGCCNVGYSWSWGPLLHPRVAIKCQLEIAVFFMSGVLAHDGEDFFHHRWVHRESAKP